MEDKTRILFVCMGNICRSPAAHGIFEKMAEDRGLAERFEIDSAGTYGGHRGELPDARMRAAARERGYELTHPSRRVTEEDFDRFDMLIAMDDRNYHDLMRLAPTREAVGKVYRMTQFCRRHRADHIPDPYYEGAKGFERVLDLLEDGCETLLEEVTKTK